MSFGRIAVVGAGAMGSFYASRFAEMDPGAVFLIASGERARRLRREGFTVNGKPYRIPVSEPGDKGAPADLILVAVKNHHLEEAIGEMAPFAGDGTVFLSVMNGIDSEERIGAAHGMKKVLYAVAVGIDALREGNAMTYTTQGKLFFGEKENRVPTERVKRLQALFDRAGIIHETPEDMIRILWWKYMINVGINQTSAVLRAPYGVFQRSPEARELMESAMREVTAVAAAARVRITGQDIENWYGFLAKLSPAGKTSMLQDVEGGRKTEVEMFAGKMIELGKKYGIPVPVNETLYRIIRVIEQSAAAAAGG